MNNNIEKLVERYFNGETSLEEEKQLQVFFQREDLPNDLKTYQDQLTMAGLLKQINADSISDADLFAKLDLETDAKKVIPMNKESSTTHSTFFTWVYRVAAAVALIMVGFWIGGQFKSTNDVDEIRQELAVLKNQLESSSASGRLQAVSNVKNTSNSSNEMILTLSAVMKNDPNMHVRTKAVEALTRIGKPVQVTKSLSDALLEETEPAVQIAIIEALVVLNEKGAIQSLEKLTEEGSVLKEVKEEAYMGIFKLKEI